MAVTSVKIKQDWMQCFKMFLLQIFLADKESLEILLSSWQLTEESQRGGQKKKKIPKKQRKEKPGLYTV